MKNKALAIPTRMSFAVDLTVNQFLTVEKRDETLEKKIDKTFPHNRDAAGLFLSFQKSPMLMILNTMVILEQQSISQWMLKKPMKLKLLQK